MKASERVDNIKAGDLLIDLMHFEYNCWIEWFSHPINL